MLIDLILFSLNRIQMGNDEIVLGTSKIDPRYRITLIQPLPKILDVEVGDLIIFIKDKDGNIKIKPSKISKIS